MTDAPYGSGVTNISLRMTRQDSLNNRWAHTGSVVSNYLARQPSDTMWVRVPE